MAVSFSQEKDFKPLNGSCCEGIIDYTDILTDVKGVDWVFYGYAIQMRNDLKQFGVVSSEFEILGGQVSFVAGVENRTSASMTARGITGGNKNDGRAAALELKWQMSDDSGCCAAH